MRDLNGVQKFLLAIGILFALAGGISVAQQAVNVVSSTGLSQGSTTSGQTGSLVMGAATTAAPTYVTGQTSPLSLDTLGNLRTVGADPCQARAKVYVPISQTTSTQLITGTASNRTYVCHIFVMASAAESITLVSGTGSTCGTSVGAMIGGTTALSAISANGGYSLGGAGNAVAKSDTDADNVCLLQAGSVQLTGVISYVVAPN